MIFTWMIILGIFLGMSIHRIHVLEYAQSEIMKNQHLIFETLGEQLAREQDRLKSERAELIKILERIQPSSELF